ncbi:MAG: type II toxin-antitoxin system RelE/ParE family toxin [Rhodanobacteraceae bacterium]
MTRIHLVPRVFKDLDRIVAHLERHEVEHAQARADEIVGAFDVLGGNPLIGRPAGEDVRELIIGHGSHGYVALYRYLPWVDTVLILAVRAQRESGYARPE